MSNEALEANKRVAWRIFAEGFNRGDPDALDEILADDFVNHTMPPGVATDRQGLKDTILTFHAEVPDEHYELLDLVAERDLVLVHALLSGSHTKQFRGFDPTGRHFSIHVFHLLRLRNGRVCEHWGARDDLAMLRQLGIGPAVMHPTESSGTTG